MKLDRKNIFKKALSELINIKNRPVTGGVEKLYIPVSGIGDGILFTAVAKAIYLKEGKKLLVSHHHNELYKNNPYIETIDDLYDPILTIDEAKQIEELGFDVVYPSYFKFPLIKNRFYLQYPAQHIIAQTASRTGFQGKIDIKPEIFLSDEEKKFGRFSKDKKQIAIMSTAIDKHKQYDKWQQVIDKIKNQFYIIQIGSPKDKPLKDVDDKRGKFTLRECACVLYNSDLFVGQVGGLMHMARAVDCPAVIAYTSAEPEYFVNYVCNSNVLPSNKCKICVNSTSPYSIKCKNHYCCINSIDVDDITAAIYEQLGHKSKELSYETQFIQESKNAHLTDYVKRYSKQLFFNRPSIPVRAINKIKRIIKYIIRKVMNYE